LRFAIECSVVLLGLRGEQILETQLEKLRTDSEGDGEKRRRTEAEDNASR